MNPTQMAMYGGPFAGQDAASFQRKEQEPLSAASASTPGVPRLSTAQLLFWIPFACAQPVCVALLGVLTRYLQASSGATACNRGVGGWVGRSRQQHPGLYRMWLLEWGWLEGVSTYRRAGSVTQ